MSRSISLLLSFECTVAQTLGPMPTYFCEADASSARGFQPRSLDFAELPSDRPHRPASPDFSNGATILLTSPVCLPLRSGAH
jgi:hypothetical protein